MHKGCYLWLRTELSYSWARKVLSAKLKAIGLDTSRYGLHSLRIGGASAAITLDDNSAIVMQVFGKDRSQFDFATTSHDLFSSKLGRKFFQTTSNKSHMVNFFKSTFADINSALKHCHAIFPYKEIEK